MPREHHNSSGRNGSSIVVCSPAASLKRPPPDSEHRNRNAIKRRSSRACSCCRARKVRCDITIRGSPCTNCRLDNVDCVLVSRRGAKINSPLPSHHATAISDSNTTSHPQLEDQREDQQLRSRPHLSYQQPQHYQHYKRMEEVEEDNEEQNVALMTPISSSRGLSDATVSETHETHNTQPPQVSSSSSSPPTGKIYEVAVGLTFDHDEDDNNDGNASDGGDGVGQNTPSLRASSYSHAESNFGSVASAVKMDSPLSLLNSTLPSFIRPLPRTLADDDLEYLERKGAFTLPEPEIRDEILRSYVSTVHPFMPILDLGVFLRAVTSNTNSEQINLLLFQAVMFAGLSALDPQVVQRMGFKSTKQARQVFFSRVRFLHDLDIEIDGTSMLQALLLMSLWYGGRNEIRNTWYYTGLALSLAQNMGLQREPDDSHPERHLRRRLWWSLYIRDRLIALGTRRPMRIRDDDYEVSMLSQQDFDYKSMDESITPSFDGGNSQEDVNQETYLPLICVELAKLCICIGHVLTSQYTTLGCRSLWTKALMVVPKQDIDRSVAALDLERHEREIDDWYQALHPDVSKIARYLASERQSCNCTQWHWMVVDMLRLTLISLLHRPQSLRPFPTNAANNDKSALDLLKAARTKLKATARELTRLAQRMLHHEQIRYLPTSGVPALLSASLTHMMDLEAQDDDIRDSSIYRLDQTMQVLKELSGIYASADSAINYLGMVIRKTGISTRVSQVAAIAPEFSCASPNGKRRSSVSITGSSYSQRRDSMALKKTAMGILPRPDSATGTHNFFMPNTMLSTNDTHTLQQAISRPTRDNLNANSQLRPNSLLAKAPNLADVGLGTIPELPSFDTPYLLDVGICAVESQEDINGLDHQSMLAYDSLLGPLTSLDYDIDPELFNAQFAFYNEELLSGWPASL